MSEPTIAEVARRSVEAARVLYRHNIDFCCCGQRTLHDACAAAQVHPDALLAEISAEENAAPVPSARWDHAPLPSLVRHLVEDDHRHHRDELARLEVLAIKVREAHPEAADRLAPLAALVESFRQEVLAHLEKEESVLFPWISAGRGRSAQEPVQAMHRDHEHFAGLLAAIRRATSDFEAPPEACASWRALWAGLRELDFGLRQHIHLENNVLFPRALQGW